MNKRKYIFETILFIFGIKYIFIFFILKKQFSFSSLINKKNFFFVQQWYAIYYNQAEIG